MKTLQFKLALFLFVSILFNSCSPEDDGIYVEKINEVSFEYNEMDLEILDLVNNYRASKGLKTLKKLNIISAVALSHTNYMIEIGEANHDNFDQRYENLVTNAGAKSVGENVALGFSSAKSVVDAWIESYRHRTIIENESYTIKNYFV
jgi:uncharacterized protein YkwD